MENKENDESAAPVAERPLYRFQVDNKEEELEFSHIDPAAITEAATHKKAHLAINEKEMEGLATPYLEWRQSLSSSFGAFFRARLRSEGAVALSRRNVKFILALCKLMQLDSLDRFALSLDMVAQKPVVESIIQVLIQRRCKASRTFQILSEVKHMIAYVLETAHSHLSPKERAAVRLSQFDAFNLIGSQLKECQLDKNAQAAQRAALDESDLVAMGKILDEKERAHLRGKVEDFLSRAPAADADGKISKSDALAFQAHFVTYLLCNNVLPCVRQQLLVALKIGDNFKWDPQALQYVIDTPPFGKTKQPIFIKIPRTETGLFKRWIHDVRPQLLGPKQADHHYLFVGESGQARKDVSALVKSVQLLYLAKAAPTHSWRHVQAIESAKYLGIGADSEENKAMCAGRAHKPSTSAAFYCKPNRKRQSELAEQTLAQLRAATAPPPKKRARVAEAAASSSMAWPASASSHASSFSSTEAVHVKREPMDPPGDSKGRDAKGDADDDEDAPFAHETRAHAARAARAARAPTTVAQAAHSHDNEDHFFYERKYPVDPEAEAQEPAARTPAVKLEPLVTSPLPEAHDLYPCPVVKREPGVSACNPTTGGGPALKGGKSKRLAIVID